MTEIPDDTTISALLGQAIEKHRGFAFEEAERLYREVLALRPAQADALHNLGVMYAIGLGRPLEALPHFEAALNVDATRGQYWFSYVDALIRAEQWQLAEPVLQMARAQGLPAAMANSLVERIRTGASAVPADVVPLRPPPPERGPRSAREATALLSREQRAQVAFERGNQQEEQGLLQEAEASLREAVELAPAFADAHSNLALVLYRQGEHALAELSYRRALQLQPGSAAAHYNLGVNARAQGRLDEAQASFRQALRLQPDLLAARVQIDQHLRRLGRWVDAEVLWRDWLRHDPGNLAGLEHLGAILRQQQRLEEALECIDQALAIEPDAVRLFHQRADVLKAMGRFGEAEQACREVLALDETDAAAWNQLGNVFNAMRRLVDAELAFRKAVALNPQLVAAHANLGLVLQNQGRLHESEEAMRHALALTPGDRGAHGNLLFVLNYHPDKSGEEVFSEYQAYERKFFLPLREKWAAHANGPLHQPDGSHRRLKVGYVSPDFRHHSMANFLEPLLAAHDHSAVCLYAYAELQREDGATARYKRMVEHWVPTRGLGDAELAERIRADGIDVLVDLAGHTGGNRLDVFARKPAPVSLSFMGYGYTTGLSAIDYYLTDAACVPAGSESVFAEKPWRLPVGSVYRPSAAASMGDPGPSPVARNGHITFGSLTRAIRINDHCVRVWSRLLHRVPHSRLVVDSVSFRDSEMREALAARFVAQGIDRERLVIGFHSPPWDLLRGIDIGLDCFPHNSGTTLFETLYMGAPFVTLASRPSMGRVGSGALTGVGHPEWIASTEDEYVDIAAALAGDLPRLAALRVGLRDEMRRSALMDELGFAREVEAAYREMFLRWEKESRT